MPVAYFCIGRFRDGKKEYRIFDVRDMRDVREITDYLGLPEIVQSDEPQSPEARKNQVVSSLLSIEISQRWVENIVACVRPEQDEARRMERHFMDSDISEYFPKLVKAKDGSGFVTRRNYPWIVEYWSRRFQDGTSLGVFPVRQG